MNRLKLLLLPLLLISTIVFAQDQPVKVMTLRTWKGLNTNVDEQDLAPEYGSIVNNIRVTKVGNLSKRPIRTQYNSSSLGSNPILFNYRYYYDSSKLLLISYDTTLKKGDDSAGTFSNIKTGMTTGKYWRAVTYKGVAYMVNGTDTNQHYDGTNIRDMGVPGPGSTSMAASDAGAGSIGSGTFKYQVTFLYDGYQDSIANTDTTTVTIGASRDIDLASIPVGAAGQGVTARKLFRTQADGSTYYYLDTIADNTTTTYADSTVDGSLDTTTTPYTDHASPLTNLYIITHKERIFLAGNSTDTSRLFYSIIRSGIALPDVFPALSYVDVSPDDGERIMGVGEDPAGNLCIFKQNRMYKLYTDGAPSEWELSAPYEASGLIAPYTLVRTPYGLMFLSRSAEEGMELRLFDGTSSKIISQVVAPTLSDIVYSKIEEAYGVYHDGKYLLAYCDSTVGAEYNNRVLIYDFEHDFWSIDTSKNIGSFGVWGAGTDRGELYSGDSVIGKVYREDAETQDLVYKLKSQFDEGTYTQTESGGTEGSPTVTLKASDLTDDYAGDTWDATSTTWNALSGATETWDYSGTYTSPAILANANAFVSVNWSETLESDYDEDIHFRIKTAATSGAIGAASYSDWYTSSPGDISGETANTYLQFQMRLVSEDIAQTPILYREGNYAVWINLGGGIKSETSVGFEYQTGALDFGIAFARKRFRQLRTNHYGGETDFVVYYKLDEDDEESFTVTLSSDSISSKKNFPYNHQFGEKARFRIEENSDLDFDFKQLKIIYSEEPIDY